MYNRRYCRIPRTFVEKLGKVPCLYFSYETLGMSRGIKQAPFLSRVQSVDSRISSSWLTCKSKCCDRNETYSFQGA
jgi:hypothetical protein